MNKAIGIRIRKLRVSKDYTQDNMAAELELTAGAYAKIERGETDPSVTRLIQIAQILDVDVAYFFQEPNASQNLQDKKSQYGTVTKQEVEQLTGLVESLQRDIEKIKTELVSLKKRKSKN